MFYLANIQAPIETANGLPNACYIDPTINQHEQNTVFCDNWVAVVFGKDIPQQGCVKPINFAGIPTLLLRNKDSNIKLSQNVCRYPSMILVDTAKRLRGPIACLYRG